MECYLRKVKEGVTFRSLYYRKDFFRAQEFINSLESAREIYPDYWTAYHLSDLFTPMSHEKLTGFYGQSQIFQPVWAFCHVEAAGFLNKNQMEGNGAENKELIYVKQA